MERSAQVYPPSRGISMDGLGRDRMFEHWSAPPPFDPSSVLLLRALGGLQEMDGCEPITDIVAIAIVAGIAYVEMPALMAAGVQAGYLEAAADGAVGLTGQGWRWYEWDR